MDWRLSLHHFGLGGRGRSVVCILGPRPSRTQTDPTPSPCGPGPRSILRRRPRRSAGDGDVAVRRSVKGEGSKDQNHIGLGDSDAPGHFLVERI